MIDISVLASKVFMLLLLMVPGFILSKCGMMPDKFGKGLSNLVLYVSQSALIILAYNCDFDIEILKRAGFVFLFAALSHIFYILVARLVYGNAPEKIRRVLQYATIFTNAGYLGIPLLESLYRNIDPNIGIYASIYNVVFNLFSWSVGCYIYSGDKHYLSAKKVFINPAILSTAVGLLFFFTPLNRWLSGTSVPAVLLYDILSGFKSTVAPLSMILIGIRMAEIDWKTVFRDRYLYPYLGLRLLLLPAVAFFIVRLFAICGVYNDIKATTVILLCAAAPAATATSMFAELFEDNTVYAGKVVAVSTLLSVVTMPIVALLLYLV